MPDDFDDDDLLDELESLEVVSPSRRKRSTFQRSRLDAILEERALENLLNDIDDYGEL